MVSNQIISYIVKYIKDNRSTKGISQIYRSLEKQKLDKYIIYTFPFILKGEAIALEMLLSKTILQQNILDKDELIDKDIINMLLQID